MVTRFYVLTVGEVFYVIFNLALGPLSLSWMLYHNRPGDAIVCVHVISFGIQWTMQAPHTQMLKNTV